MPTGCTDAAPASHKSIPTAPAPTAPTTLPAEREHRVVALLTLAVRKAEARTDCAYSSARRMSAARDMARIFPSALARGRYFMPQSVPMMIWSGVVYA